MYLRVAIARSSLQRRCCGEHERQTQRLYHRAKRIHPTKRYGRTIRLNNSFLESVGAEFDQHSAWANTSSYASLRAQGRTGTDEAGRYDRSCMEWNSAGCEELRQIRRLTRAEQGRECKLRTLIDGLASLSTAFIPKNFVWLLLRSERVRLYAANHKAQPVRRGGEHSGIAANSNHPAAIA
jgi:hypothetical protein